MTADRKETEVQPTNLDIDMKAITLFAIFTVIFLIMNHSFESAFQAHCRDYEELIETSLNQTTTGENQLHSFRANFSKYKKDCGIH